MINKIFATTFVLCLSISVLADQVEKGKVTFSNDVTVAGALSVNTLAFGTNPPVAASTNVSGTNTGTIATFVKLDGSRPMTGQLSVPSIAVTNSGASGGSIPYSSQSGLMSFLPLVANQKLYGGTNGVPEYSSGVFFGSFTRSNTAANASVSYTGTGFKPSAIVFMTCTIGDIGGSYHCNGLATTNGTACIWTRGSGMARQNSNYVINIEIDNDAGQTGTITSMDNNGFTISWARQASPVTAANVAVYYIAFR